METSFNSQAFNTQSIYNNHLSNNSCPMEICYNNGNLPNGGLGTRPNNSNELTQMQTHRSGGSISVRKIVMERYVILFSSTKTHFY